MDETVTFETGSTLFSNIGYDLQPEQYEMLHEYAQMLLSESKTQNVTAVRTASEIWSRHFLDSAVLLPYLPDGATVLDVGTGGGIPAIPLCILNSNLRITMLDSELRKIEFCQSVVDRLQLHAECLCGRAEELANDQKYRSSFDFAVSRAMAAGSMLTELSIPFVKTGGALIAMKGRNYDPAAERFQSAADVLGCSCRESHYQLLDEQKTLVFVQKNTETHEKYPRRFAKIKRNPL